MQVAINAQLLSRARSFRSGGISRHISHLLQQLAGEPRGHQFDVFAPHLPEPKEALAGPALRYHPTGERTVQPSIRILWEQSVLPLRLAKLRPHLLHSTAYVSPLAWPGKTVVTIYDLSFLRFSEAFNRGNRLYLSTMTRLSARRARRVVVISESTARDVVRLLGVPRERIDVTLLAADAHYRPLSADEVARFRAANDLPERFIFYVGTLEPRKNLAGLLRAYARLPQPRVPLYVAGGAGWRFSPIFQVVAELGLERDVRFLGFVPEDQLPHWYNAARLFAYPSVYEGFGLPVLEAMACGTPVITSNVASLPEVAGDAAEMVDPHDHAALAAAVQRVLDDDGRHESMRAAGIAQAARFTWARMAEQTVRSYERAIGGD